LQLATGVNLRTIFRWLAWLLTLMLLIACGGLWWLVYRPLPQIDGTVKVAGLQKEVTVERDGWGVPHIRASSVPDMVEAEGYVMAQDRLWQMDLLRRAAKGQLSEILGPSTLKIDENFRTLGFDRAAERDAAQLDGETRELMEAYARGVNRFIEQHLKSLPLEFSLLKYRPRPWLPSDTLAISGYMYLTLTDTWEEELARAKVTERVGADRAKDLFAEDAAMDHFVLGDPGVPNDGSKGAHAKKGNEDDDDDDDDDMKPDTVLKAEAATIGRSSAPSAFVDLTSAFAELPPSRSQSPAKSADELLPAVRDFFRESGSEIRHGLGSNNWVVSGAHTASGKPLLANDTHLELSIPPIWYELHLTAPGWNVKGLTLPGAPMVVIGHNDKIAWGFTNNGADVQDLYIESFNPAAHDEYRVKGAWSKAQLIDEVIKVKGRPDEHLKVLLTRHGPVVAREGEKAYALRWTATEPGGLANSYNFLGKATNWEEFRTVMRKVWGPGQNAVYADVQGNIGYIMAARVPIRKKGHGEVPVPGDTDDYEWTGYVPFEQLPQAFNPESGLIVTANARVVGPNYKTYLTDRWEEPYRTARIYDLLHDKRGLRPEDMLKVETDTYSYPDFFVGGQLLLASRSTKPRDLRAQKLVQDLKDWNGIADANSPEVPFLEGARRAALRLILQPYLGNDTGLYEWRSTAFLQRILTDRPAKWLPAQYKSYDELLVAAADDSVAKMAAETHSERIEDWPWKRFDALDMLHPIGRDGLLKRLLSITAKAQSGTQFSVRAATKHHGPAMRFVADLADWDNSILLIPAGESGQPGSSHYSDQFSYWFEGKEILAPFSDAAELASRRHLLILQP
jgi:penicillin amidase